MKRHLYKQLLAWKKTGNRKPLILRGARQVGKTFLLKVFAKQEYTSYLYLNFEEDPKLSNLFADNLKPATILENISIYLNQDIQPEHTLLILDEIQESPAALNSLKYFQEHASQFHVVAAGSLLGIKLANTKGFPVGKVTFLDLYPLCFFEFL
ncbi:MAG: AAA family ATPase, partial [Gammaproteobacteria bacterium]